MDKFCIIPVCRVYGTGMEAMKIIPVMLIIILTIGCGSITHGIRQEIPISSNPPGATVIIDDEIKGQTPITVELERKTKKYYIEIAKDGYTTYKTYLIRKTSTASSVGNFMLDFGLISHLIVDKSTGGAYKLTPESVSVELEKEETLPSKIKPWRRAIGVKLV